jgi:tripartite-type tricarboxylate transporter receptor subunit TctC
MAHSPRRHILGGLAGLVAAPALSLPALGQAAFPSRAVTIVVPFAPGGSTDIVSRLMAERMTAFLGSPVQVENRAGGNTIVGAEYVSRAQPDGHTILMSSGTTLSINPLVQPNLPYKVEDFAPITLATTYPFAIVAQNNGPADVAAWIAAARARPGQMTYGTNGPTTLTNVAMLMVLEKLGITMQDVTYRGDAAALNDFVAGTLDMLVVAGGTALPVRANRQGRLLVWTSLQRMPSTPEVPAIAEFSPGLEALSWFGLLAPARTPPAAIAKLHGAAVQALQDARIRERLTNDAQTVVGNTPEQFAQFLRDQDAQWRPILAKMDIPRN